VLALGPRRAVFELDAAATQPWVDHRILGSTVFPGTAYLEMVARGFAAFKGRSWQSVLLRDVGFERPLVLTYGKPKKIALTLETRSVHASTDVSFGIAGPGGDDETYCRGAIAAAGDPADKVSIESELGRMQAKLDIGQFYGELRKRSFEYGAGFSTIRELWIGKAGSGEAIARVAASPHGEGKDRHPFTYTTVLDGCLQVFAAGLRTLDTKVSSGALVPRSIGSITLRNKSFSQLWSHATVQRNGDGGSFVARIRAVTEVGDVLADIEHLELRPMARLSLAKDGRDIPAETDESESRAELVQRLRKLPREERAGALAKWLIGEVKHILGQAAEQIDLGDLDPSKAFIEIGLDSLLITELQRRIQERLEFRFKTPQALDHQSAESLAEYLLDEVLLVDPFEAAPAELLPKVIAGQR
jgi:acyl transferase domain-containing protein